MLQIIPILHRLLNSVFLVGRAVGKEQPSSEFLLKEDTPVPKMKEIIRSSEKVELNLINFVFFGQIFS